MKTPLLPKLSPKLQLPKLV